MFSDGVGLATTGTPVVGVVPHYPDTMDDVPPGEWQNADGTYSSNQYCLKTSVGEVPVRVPADFSLPAADGVTYLMPSGKNDGLAATMVRGRGLGTSSPDMTSGHWRTEHVSSRVAWTSQSATRRQHSNHERKLT